MCKNMQEYSYVGTSFTPLTTADVDMFFPHINFPLFLKPPVRRLRELRLILLLRYPIIKISFGIHLIT